VTNIEKLKEAEKLIYEVFMEAKTEYAELALNCAFSDVQTTRIKMEVKQEAELNQMKQGA
jgi:hypothetical protein